jgi:hypothetical protein
MRAQNYAADTKGYYMKPKERLFSAIDFKETDRPPHFEQKFELFEEAFGEKLPSGDDFNKCIIAAEKELFFAKCAGLYAKVIEKYKWDATILLDPFEHNPALFDFNSR